jgi:hypothetical protein
MVYLVDARHRKLIIHYDRVPPAARKAGFQVVVSVEELPLNGRLGSAAVLSSVAPFLLLAEAEGGEEGG